MLKRLAVRAVVQRSGIDPARIDDVVFAQSYASSETPCVGRWAALQAGLPVSVPGMQLDRRCGGGLSALAKKIAADRKIPLRDAMRAAVRERPDLYQRAAG